MARKDTGQEKKNPKSDVRNIKNDGKRESEPARWAMGSICCSVLHLLCPNEIFVSFPAPTSALHVGFMTAS